jgi:hypothetical protein
VFSLILNWLWAVTKWAFWCQWHVRSTSLCWWLQNRGSCTELNLPDASCMTCHSQYINLCSFYKPSYSYVEPGLLSRYSDMLRALFPAEAGDLCVHHNVRPGSGVYPAPYLMTTAGSFTGDKAAGAWTCSPSSCVEVKNDGAVLHFPIRLHGVVLNALQVPYRRSALVIR